MTIQISKPELEALILLRMRSGGFESAEDVVWHAMQAASLPEVSTRAGKTSSQGRKSLAQLFAESPFRGLDLDFERERDFGRDIEL